MKPIVDVLLVGIGKRGRWPILKCKPEAGWRVVGLVDQSSEHLAQGRQLAGLPESACFNSLETALQAVRPKATILCTPTITHVPFTKIAIDAGSAVLTEKGMATNWNEAVDVINYVRAKKGVFAVAQNYRYGGMSQLIRTFLEPGATRAIQQPFLVDYVEHRVRPEPWGLTFPFASVWDMSCHHFDNLLSWLGPVDEITAHSYRASHTQYEHDNNTSAFLKFRNGVSVNYTHTHDASRLSLRIEVHGKNGALVVRDNVAEFSDRPLQNFGHTPIEQLTIPSTDSEVGMLADFHAYVTEGREPGISGCNNLEVMAMCELMIRSIKERRSVKRDELEMPRRP
jgi:predicted dehydrogenase